MIGLQLEDLKQYKVMGLAVRSVKQVLELIQFLNWIKAVIEPLRISVNWWFVLKLMNLQFYINRTGFVKNINDVNAINEFILKAIDKKAIILILMKIILS